MKRPSVAPVLCSLAAVCLLAGCSSLLDRTYSTVEEHSSRYWESEAADTLRAETYQDIVNDLLLLIGRHTEDATLRLYNYEDDASVADALEQAASEVRNDTPLGSYAVEYITSESQYQRSYYEVTLHLSYRRTTEQLRSVVNATSTAALPDLLDAALEQGKTEVAVRIGYWGEGETEKVDAAMATAREERGLTQTAPWSVSYYPSAENAGLIEFMLDGSQSPEADASAENASAEAQMSPDGAADAGESAESPGA